MIGRKTRSKGMSGVRRKNKSKRMSGVRRKNKSKRMSGVRRNNKSRKIYGGMMRSVISKVGRSTAAKSSGKKSTAVSQVSHAMRASRTIDHSDDADQRTAKQAFKKQEVATVVLETMMKKMQPQYHNAWAVWMANIEDDERQDSVLEGYGNWSDGVTEDEAKAIAKKNELEEERKIYYPILQRLYKSALQKVAHPPPPTYFLSLNQILEQKGTKSEHIVVSNTPMEGN